MVSYVFYFGRRVPRYTLCAVGSNLVLVEHVIHFLGLKLKGGLGFDFLSLDGSCRTLCRLLVLRLTLSHSVLVACLVLFTRALCGSPAHSLVSG